MANALVRTLKRTALWRRLQRGALEKSAKQNGDGIEFVAKSLRASIAIDWARYAEITHCREMGYDPAFHYVLSGEAEGYASDEFDARFYAARYGDVNEQNRLLHYVTKGQGEGRFKTRADLDRPVPALEPDPARPTILVVDHQASRSGAPILGWNIIKTLKPRYKIVSVVFGGGDLMEAFEAEADIAIACPVLDQDRAPYLAKVLAAYRPMFAVVNGIGCCAIADDLVSHHIPYVTLVQEFAGVYGTRNEKMRALYRGTAALVCASQVILDGSLEFYPFVPRERCFLQPQGRSQIPPITKAEIARKSASAKEDDIAALLRPPGEKPRFVVAGLGTVDIRKAVDLFIATAIGVIHARPNLNIHFVWIGHRGGRSDHDPYPMYIEEQLARADTKGRLTMLPATADIDTVYETIDVLYLSSRLDPMPNICIDAAMARTPVVCFDKATGFADLIRTHADLIRTRADLIRTRADLAPLVVPYLDIAGAGRIITRLAEEPATTKALGESLRRMAETTFDMEAYVGLIEKLGRAAAESSKA